MHKGFSILIFMLLLASMTACTQSDFEQNDELPEVQNSTVPEQDPPANFPTPTAAATNTPTLIPTITPTSTPTATYTPSPTPTPIIGPASFHVESLASADAPQDAVLIQHPLFGQVHILDELNRDTRFRISWTDDNPETAVIRYRNEDGIVVELNASTDADWRSVPIEVGQDNGGDELPRHSLFMNSGEIFPAVREVERLATVELTDADGNSQPMQILFSRHDYEIGVPSPVQLAQPQYDQFELGLDWRSEHYTMVGSFADWLNERPELWNRIIVEIDGTEPMTWRDMRQHDGLLHSQLASAEYEEQMAFYYLMVGGDRQRFAVDNVPYYTKFELVPSPRDDHLFYTLRAGRDSRVTEEMLQEMGGVIQHMFSNRPDYLHQLAENEAVHSVAPGKDLRVLPEISILPDEILEIIINNEDFGSATGIALLDRHPEISASASHYFKNDTPVLGYTLMHEIVHQVQYMIYGPSWVDATVRYFENYMDYPGRDRIPNVDYYETSPWEWDALLTPAWFSQGSNLYEYVEPYLDLEVGDTGTTIREHLQRRWGDSLEAYD